MSDQVCRWGFLSTASIGRKNWQAIKLSGNGVIAAVASRSKASAQAFIDECQTNVPFETAPTAHESYDDLIEDPNVDAVYIPLPTGMRKEWVIKAANAGKHVLCEKPCAANFDQLQEMIEACQTNNVQFMDGVMYMHSDRMIAMRAAMEDTGTVGAIKRITSQFSFNAPPEFKESNIRTHSDMEPHGCLGDLGWYTIRFSLWVMNYAKPLKVRGTILDEHKRDDSPDAVPMEFSGDILFEDGVSASFYNSFQTQHQQWANVSGTNGFLHTFDFVLPYKNVEDEDPQLKFYLSNSEFKETGCDFEMKNFTREVSLSEGSHSTDNSQETRLFRKFGELAMSGTPDNFWPEASLKTQKILDLCFQSARNGGGWIEV